MQAPPDRPGDDSSCHRMTDDWWAICSECWARDPLLRPSVSCLLGRMEGTKVGAHSTSSRFQFHSILIFKGILNLILGLNVPTIVKNIDHIVV